MNVGRGLFRAWIFLTVIWLIVIGWFAFDSIRYQITAGSWEYAEWMKVEPWEVDWSRPLYETRKSPAAEKLSVSFYQREIDNVNFNEEVKAGHMTRITMPDRSSLYLDARFTKDDQEYLAKAFWDQRWWRYASFAKVWVTIFVVPPIVLFILGWAILWVGRGFKTVSQ
jgi:hypothetical protein